MARRLLMGAGVLPGFMQVPAGDHYSKKNFYAEKEATYVWHKDPVPLAADIGKVRAEVMDKVGVVDSTIQTGFDTWIKAEEKFTRLLRDISDPRERAFPALFYVAVGGLGGSVVARGILSKLTYPLIFSAATSAYFMPITTLKVAHKVIDPIYPPADRQLHADKLSKALSWPSKSVESARVQVAAGLRDMEKSVREFVDRNGVAKEK